MFLTSFYYLCSWIILAFFSPWITAASSRAFVVDPFQSMKGYMSVNLPQAFFCILLCTSLKKTKQILVVFKVYTHFDKVSAA